MRYLILLFLLVFSVPAVAETKVTHNLAYGSAKLQKLDVYQPDTCKGACPVVIWVHGGGWRHGNKDQRSTPDFLMAWASQGIVMVSIDYRLSPDVVHPAHIEDVAAATAWVKRNISRYGANPSRISLLGHSAGAHLVALAGTSATYLPAVGIDPATLKGVFPIDTAGHDLNNVPRPVKKMVEQAFGSDPAIIREASPLFNIVQDREYPPFILAAVEVRADAVKTNQDLAQRLKAVGGSAQLFVMDYGQKRQLKAHGDIARDLINMASPMTSALIRHVLSH